MMVTPNCPLAGVESVDQSLNSWPDDARDCGAEDTSCCTSSPATPGGRKACKMSPASIQLFARLALGKLSVAGFLHGLQKPTLASLACPRT